MGQRRSRGAFVLAAVFFVMVVIVLLVASLFRLVPQEVRWSADHKRETLAYYAATAGIKHALAWIRHIRLDDTAASRDPFERAGGSEPYELITLNLPSAYPVELKPESDPAPNGPDTYFPRNVPALHSRPGRIQLGQGWNAEVFVVPDKQTPPHPFLAGRPGRLPPCYTLVALAYVDSNGNGIRDGGELAQLRIESAAVETTFARYAYFVDRWPDQGANTTAFAVLPGMAEPLFSGPVHTNDTPVVRVLNGPAFWSQPDGFVPPFGGEVSFNGDLVTPKAPDSYDGVAYYGGNFEGNSAGDRPYLGPPPDPQPERYQRLYKQGQQALRRTQRIELPNDWERLARAAWGAESGREVAVDAAPANQVFVNHEDLGIVSTGGLQQLSLDIVDGQGRSLVFDPSTNVLGTATTGEPIVRMVQAEEVTYVAGYTTVPVTTTQVLTVDGPYTTTQTHTSDTAQPGYSLQVSQLQTGTTTETVPAYVQVGSTVINDPPGGAGPASGGTVVIPQYSETSVSREVPVYEDVTQYVFTETLSGNGPHEVTNEVPTGETREEPILESYAPQDAVVSAVDQDIRLPVNYFVPPDTPITDFAAFQGETLGLDILIPRGKTAVIRQDRQEGRTFDVQILDGEAAGVLAVYGKIENLKGVNRGPRSILAADPRTPRLKPTRLKPIAISDQVLQFKVAPGALPTDGHNSLGLLGSRITVPGDATTLARFPAAHPFYLYASIFAAEQGFEAEDLTPGPTPALGELRVVGGLIQKEIGRLLAGNTGWSSRYRYDRFLSNSPPPAYPPDGRFEITFFRVTVP